MSVTLSSVVPGVLPMVPEIRHPLPVPSMRPTLRAIILSHWHRVGRRG